MKLCFPQYFEAKARFLTYTVVAKALTDAGHELTADDGESDAVLFSICDATEFRKLARCRKEHRGKPLIVGGAFAFNFWACKLYADGVWVGEVYDMAACKTVDEILESPHCYTGDGLPTASQRVEWPAVPVAQIDPKKAYYWGGNGCKNKCWFCFTSWTRPHNVNSRFRIQKAIDMCRKRKIHLMVTSNEYENDPGAKTFDMMLKDYVREPVKANLVRCGVEFATEKSRRKYGKPISNNDLFRAVQKAERENVALRLFHIAGVDSRDDWESYIDLWCGMLEKAGYHRMLTLMFNNLQYQNYTPLYRERRGIDPSRYIDRDTTKEWFYRLQRHTKSVLVMPPSSFQHVCCRMGVELAREREQAEFWQSMMTAPNKKLTIDQAYNTLMDTGVLDTPMLSVSHKTGKIRIVAEAGRQGREP